MKQESAAMDEDITKIKRKLLEMKKEFAQKQKKLEKARRAARVRDHVRKKIKEHKEMESSLKSSEGEQDLATDSKNGESKSESQQDILKADDMLERAYKSTSTEERSVHRPEANLPKILSPVCLTGNFLSTNHLTDSACHGAVEACQDSSQMKIKNTVAGHSENSHTRSDNQIFISKSLDIENQSNQHSDSSKIVSTIVKSQSNGVNQVSKYDVPKSKYYSKPTSTLQSKDFEVPKLRFKDETKTNFVCSENVSTDSSQNDRGDSKNITMKQEGSVMSSENKSRKSIDERKLFSPQFSKQNAKFDVKSKTIKERNRHLHKQNGWIDTDFQSDQFDFRSLPQNHHHGVVFRKQSLEDQDQSGWLSTVKRKERTNTRLPNKRNITKSTESHKSKIPRNSLTSMPFKETVRSSAESLGNCKAVDCKMSSKTVKLNEKLNTNVTNGDSNCTTGFTPSLNIFNQAEEFQKPLTKQTQNLNHHLPAGVSNQENQAKMSEEPSLCCEKLKEKNYSHAADIKDKLHAEANRENYLVRTSESDEDVIKTSQSEVKISANSSKKSGSNEQILQLFNTQESLSLTPTFKSTLCSLRDNHKINQNNFVVGENKVTDSEFLNILGIQHSHGHIKHAVIHDSTECSLNPRLTKEDQTNLSQESRDAVIDEHAAKESKNILCSAFDNYLPPSQTTSEFSEYTELDSIPFSQFELSEDLLSSGNSQQKKNLVRSTEALVRRRSRRISATKSFKHSFSGSWSDSISSTLSNGNMFTKNRRPSQAQQRKAAMVNSIFQYLQDKAKESDSTCDFDLTPDFDFLKEQKVSGYTHGLNPEHANLDNGKNDGKTKRTPFNHLVSCDKLSDDTTALDVDNDFQDREIMPCPPSQQSFCSPLVLCKTKGSASKSFQNVNEKSEFSMTQADNHLENQAVEVENNLETEIHKSQSSTLESDAAHLTYPENSLVPMEEKKRLSKSTSGTLISETGFGSKECSESQILSPCDPKENSDDKSDYKSQKSSDNICDTLPRKSIDKVDYEPQRHSDCKASDDCHLLDSPNDESNKIGGTNGRRSPDKWHSLSIGESKQENKPSMVCTDHVLICEKTTDIQPDRTVVKNIPLDTTNDNKNESKSHYQTKAESDKRNVNLQQTISHVLAARNDMDNKPNSAIVPETERKLTKDFALVVAGDKVPAQTFVASASLKDKLKLDLSCIDSNSLNASGNNTSPQVHKKDNVSSPFYNGKNNFASPSNILNSMLSPVTPIVDKDVSKSVRSLSRKSISFTSTPIRKPGTKAMSIAQNQLDVDFDSPISKSRSASSASFIIADLANSPDFNRSQDDLTQVYNKALSVLFSPQSAHLSEKINDKSDSICSEIPPALELSTNLSLVPVCDESYPSPGQMPVLDKHPLDISTSVCDDCPADVTEANETDMTKLTTDKTANKSKTLPMSPHVVHPWKKLARTATTPVQILEAETSSFEQGSFSFTSISMRSKSKFKNRPDIKSNMRFEGCFQSDFQDAVVSLLYGQVKNQSHPDIGQAYIVSVQATSLTVWGEDNVLGWTTELDWRLSPESHILKACLMPGSSRVAVLVTGWMASSLFASVLTYEWDTEETVRINIPFEDLPFQICSLMRVEACPASENQLYFALSSENQQTIQQTQLCVNQKGLVTSNLFQCCRGKIISLVLLEGKEDALISLSYDQKLTIWSCSLGAAIKTVSVDSSVPCLEALVSARASRGFIFLNSLWRVYDGSCGGLIVMNPLNGKLKVLHTHQVPNNTWRRVDSFKKEGRFLCAVSNQGSLCVWDRYNGVLLGSTKSKTTTSAALLVSQDCGLQLLVGEIHGCVHIYSSSKLDS